MANLKNGKTIFLGIGNAFNKKNSDTASKNPNVDEQLTITIRTATKEQVEEHRRKKYEYIF